LLKKKPHVAARIAEIQLEFAAECSMSRAELIHFLIAAIRTPIADIGPTSPLCQEWSRDEHPVPGTGKRLVRTRIKSVGKLDAAKQLASLMGWNEPDKIQVNPGPSLLAQLEERAKHLVSSLNRAGCADV